MKRLQKKQLSAHLLCHFLVAALVYPIYHSNYGLFASADYILTHYFAIRIISAVCFEGNLAWKKKSILGYAVLLFAAGFNVFAFHANKTYHGWYTGQINMTIAFLFFLALLFTKESADINSEAVLRFVLYAVSIIAAASLIPGLLGYMNVQMRLTGIELIPKLASDPTYCWVYAHKSEYSFLLILCLSLSVVYQRLYTRAWYFWGSLAVYMAGLVLANTRVTMLAALFIFAGSILDWLIKKAGGFRWKHLLLFVPFVLVGIVMLVIFSRKRDIFTLGSRTYIWAGTLARILDAPAGVGPMLAMYTYPVADLSHEVSNGHNVFLNAMLHFSLYAGIFCILISAAIAIAAVWKNRSFRTLGILAALFIPLNMDWCLTIGQVPLALLLLYFIFFHPLRSCAPAGQPYLEESK